MMRQAAIGIGLTLALALAAPSRPSAQATSGWILWEKNMNETLDIRLLCFPGSFDPRPRPKG